VEARYATVPRVRIELVRDAASDYVENYAENPIRGTSEVWRLLRQEIAGWDRAAGAMSKRSIRGAPLDVGI
jgi:hypothetical protein